MSLQSLRTIAVERDHDDPKRTKTGRAPSRAPGAESPLTRTDVLIAAIPTEVLALYTGVVTVVVSNSDAANRHLSMRWTLYILGFVAIAVWLGGAYVRTPAKKRRFPFVETLAALIAFAAWGLVMPGSPLGEELSSSNENIWYALITAGGLIALGALKGTLSTKAKVASG